MICPPSRTLFPLALSLFLILISCLSSAFCQSIQPTDRAHSVLSESVLNPPLRSPEVSLRFSPNGKYLLFQDPSGVDIISINAHSIVAHVGAIDIYPAQFSADSQSFTVVTGSLTYGTWRLPEGQKVAGGDLSAESACLDGQLSPDGRFFACVSPKFKFTLHEIASRKLVFEDSLFFATPRLSGPVSSAGYPRLNLLPLDILSAFARPFGFVLVSPPRPVPGRSLASSSIYFTPDAKALVVNTSQAAVGFDLTTRKKFDVSDRFHKLIYGSVALQSLETAVGIESAKDKKLESLLFNPRNGRILSKLSFTADHVCLTSNPRYAILYSSESGSRVVQAFDLSENRALHVPPNASMDVFQDVLAVYNAGGFIALYRLGDQKLISMLRLPPSGLTLLTAAAVAPDFDQLAISVDGAGAFFELPGGKRLSSSPQFTAVNFLGQHDATLVLPSSYRNPARTLHMNTSNDESSSAWEISKEASLHSNGPALLEYLVGTPTPRAVVRDFQFSKASETQLPFRLRALDPASGKELWKRDFDNEPPTPFADPQGDRFVLGWRAKSAGARESASHNPATKQIYKNAKLDDDDSYFEALDVLTGHSVGGILVQSGSGPTSYDSAFSVGDSLVLVKDGVRVSLYSLADGTLKARLVGTAPGLSAENQLLSLCLTSGYLAIYDSNTGSKLDQQPFQDGLVYSRFSADGKKLLVLTERESAIIVDLSKIRETHSAQTSSGN